MEDIFHCSLALLKNMLNKTYTTLSPFAYAHKLRKTFTSKCLISRNKLINAEFPCRINAWFLIPLKLEYYFFICWKLQNKIQGHLAVKKVSTKALEKDIH